MQAYGIQYFVKGDDRIRNLTIDAKNIESARKKIARRHGFKDVKQIQIKTFGIIGYF